MKNIIAEGYVHSKKWTFLNQLHNIYTGDFTFNISDPKNGINAILNKEIAERKTKEKEFYRFFGVRSASEWANKYLIPAQGSNQQLSLRQKILKVVNSSKMYHILNGLFTEEKIKKALVNELEKNTELTYSGIINELTENLNTNDIATAIAKLIKNRETAEQKQVLRLFKEGLDLQKVIINARKLTSNNSEKIKKVVSEIRKKYGSSDNINDIIEQSCDFLYNSLTKEYEVEPEKALKIKKVWKEILETDRKKDTQRKLTSFQSSYIIGELQEQADKFFFDITTDIPNELEDFIEEGRKRDRTIRFKSYGKQLVDRFGKRNVQSKIDTKVLINEKGKVLKGFNIQEKNSFVGIFDELEEVEEFSRLSDKSSVGWLKLSSGFDLDYYLEHIKQIQNESVMVTEEMLQVLVYLLVNLNILNKYTIKDEEKLYKGKNTLTGEDKSAQYVQDLIAKIFSQQLTFFIADFIESGVEKTPYKVAESTDFFIFKSRVLIPVSEIYIAIQNNINNFLLNMESAKVKGIKVESKLTKEFKSAFEELYKNKLNAVGSFKPERDYTDQPLVNIGSAFGNEVKNNIRINNLKLNFDIKNLVAVNSLINDIDF